MEPIAPQKELLQALNQFTRRAHSADEVYIFDVLLCDNEIDRDFERFSLSALQTMKTLFVGKTGIFDHNPSGTNQTARIFSTRLETHSEQHTSTGEPYTCLKGSAYMVRTDSNQDLIREIDAGIKKEVSVSCTATSHTCSVCGKDRRTGGCPHVQGELYQGMLCHTVLSDITDAYEWSFVAVPAQRQAGVTKQYGGKAESERVAVLQKQLQSQQAQLAAAEADVRKEIVTLCYLSGQPLQKSLLQAAERMTLSELFSLRQQLRQETQQQGNSQLQPAEKKPEATLQQFQMK
ncbi:MAG: hypothetical protein Q4D37_04850 [Oscillospiraceae bacterium]|nr:hypothetical protein [Oscillospiraceae bacterium]